MNIELTNDEKVARVVEKTGLDYYQVIMFSDAILDSFLKDEFLKSIQGEE